MKQIQYSILAERNDSKRQYEQPSIEVVELGRQTLLIVGSPNAGNPDPGSATEEDW